MHKHTHTHTTAEEDFVPFNTTRMIRPENINQQGETQICEQFCTRDDIIVEGEETFFVAVSPLTDRVKFTNPDKTAIEITIQDNDGI